MTFTKTNKGNPFPSPENINKAQITLKRSMIATCFTCIERRDMKEEGKEQKKKEEREEDVAKKKVK